ncbi:MAG TPA: sigma-70 family RNA polymerase sigma factor [archaeon]|nr:sigma-70 family RNA polymerase sigma factor [archaeon]
MTKALEFTDDGLLRRMMAGDEEAFTLLYRRRHPAIYRFALHMSGNAAVAEDVTQEVFMTLIRDATRFDPARGTLGGYLFGVARNLVRRRWEQERNSFPLPPEGEHLPPHGAGAGVSGDGRTRNGSGRAEDEFASFETVGRVRQAVATLPANYREVVVLCEFEEMSYEEAADALDCPIGTVRSRLHRARALLVEKLRESRPVRRAAVGE